MSTGGEPTRLVAALFGTLKVMQMYGRGHDATAGAVRSLEAAIRTAAGAEPEVSVAVRGRRLLVNDAPMRSSECGTLALAFLVDELTRRRVARITFPAAVKAMEIEAFVAMFLELDLAPPDPAGRLIAAAATAGARRIAVEPRGEDAEEAGVLEERREMAMRTYLRGLRAFRDVLRHDGLRDRMKVRRAQRAVHGLVERFLENETAVLALAQIRGHDARLFNHSLNVCVYALTIGQRLGMTRRQLGELGMAALFHDLGKTGGAGGGWNALRDHPGRGARRLLETGTAHEGILKSAIAAYEHHAHLDGTGFPRLDHEPHLVSRIVAIADCYESLTSPRPYRAEPYTPTDAFALMSQKAGTLFDPLLLKVFVNAVGIYPVGSVVRLSSGEIAMVVEGPRADSAVDRPRVRVLDRRDGRIAPHTVVDLAEREPNGSYFRDIVAALRNDEIFPTISEFVAAI